jgi:cob(I)alamin adenosyltransferase
MKIYTKTGDAGETGLFGGQRVGKDHVRVDAYGDVDELNSAIGLAVAHLATDTGGALARQLREVQTELFTIGSNLATPAPEDGGRPNAHIPVFREARIHDLERWIDEADAQLQPLKTFVLPGGTESAARLHLARTICRRAERRVVTLGREAHVDANIPVYLNRLSDYLFTVARLANHSAGVEDVPWKPERDEARGERPDPGAGNSDGADAGTT